MSDLGTPEVVETTALQEITKGEVDLQVSTAKRYPRSIKRFKQDALSMATLDQETAAGCFYAIPRAGQVIEGPSIRLAEIVASCWGNLRCESRVIDTNGDHVTAQGTVWDMEKNVLVRTEVRRRITNKNGKRYTDDMIVVTGNAAASIAFRNAIFKVVPMAHTKEVFEAARQCAVGNVRTLAARRDAAFAWFAKLGIDEQRVLAAIGRPSVDDVTTDDVGTLQGLRTAIKEESTTIEEAFPPPAPKEGKQKIGGKRRTKQQSKNEPPPLPEEPAPPHDPETGEVYADVGPPPMSDDEVKTTGEMGF
jgi:hypothetical protein